MCDDFSQWQLLWSSYNAFYGREGDTALPVEITNETWKRFFDPGEPMFAVAAVSGDKLIGLAHYLYHRSTSRIEQTCYLQDLFTLPTERGRGVGRMLIESVFDVAKNAGIKRVYWQTQDTNTTACRLYDKLAKHAGFIVYGTELQ